MSGNVSKPGNQPHGGALHALAHDVSGNTLALMAASLLPLLGIIGGGIDMSRSYLAQSRLQQACDAGVLAARKTLGSQVAVDGNVPAETATIGNRFFNVNFRDGAYGTEDRAFQLFLEGDNSLTGEASVTVPTAVMNVFGIDEVNVAVKCGAVLSFQNLDLMMVLDTTGSMRHTNAGDSLSRIDTMKQVIRDFHAEMEANKGSGVRLRYGFVPYASNVNVGHLLRDEWVVDDWVYQSREFGSSSTGTYTREYQENWVRVSGSGGVPVITATYAPTWHAGTPPPDAGSVDLVPSGGTPGYMTCDQTGPVSDYNAVYEVLATDTEPFPGPPSGTKTTTRNRVTRDGTYYYNSYDGTNCNLYAVEHDNIVETYDHIYHPAYSNAVDQWVYRPIDKDVSNWRSETAGCMEERSTYQIDDYDNIDLTRALDLDLDTVPNGGDPDTQWRPRYPDIIYTRAVDGWGNGPISPAVLTTWKHVWPSGKQWYSGCPAPAINLSEMDSAAISSYLSTLTPESATYHDIGMIWGGRLVSPTGLFANQNKDVPGSQPTNRNLIFLTDGQTEPYDLAYGAYGVDPLDLRRWDKSSSLTLAETIEQRFLAACKEVKKRNVTVWVIAFGTELNPVMTECAGEGHYFEADNADQLSEAFKSIAESFGDLRIST